MSKVIAFTGGSGLLAVNMALMLSTNYDIVLLLHKSDLSDLKFKKIFLDLDSIDEISHHLNHLNVDIVINCAALTSVEKCEKEPEQVYVNTK